MAGCRSLERPRRAKGNRLRSNSTLVEKYPSRTRESSEDCIAFTLDKTEEILGRGVLYVQANGPRYIYFIIFLRKFSTTCLYYLKYYSSSLYTIKVFLKIQLDDE